jgi:hypothetical protein
MWVVGVTHPENGNYLVTVGWVKEFHSVVPVIF